MTPSRPRVVVGMSGGVDSSVAAWTLLQQGYDVHGLFMVNWDEDEEGYCTAASDFRDAEAVCRLLEIPLHRINFAAEYRERVFARFVREHSAGRTPNPDVLCNREIKFGVFLRYAKRLGADRIATGHYARVEAGTNGCKLLKGVDPGKDQSYFLHAIGQAALRTSLFPLGDLRKAEVRELARELGFPTHAKRDSTGICFIGERDFRVFLNRYVPIRPGAIETPEGRVIGRHRGVAFYTLGQRQGLELGGIRNAREAPWYVAAKDVERNVLTVVQDPDHPLLKRRILVATDPHWISAQPLSMPLRCQAKVRYRHAEQPCRVTPEDGGRLRVEFDRTQRALTPGQFVVFYDGEECLGGATITEVPATELGAGAPEADAALAI